jgi:P4 family phage/plasmid primase-like protien
MDFAPLHQIFNKNVSDYPAILEVLASELGVRRESLQQLGVGYAPTVQFSKGRNTQGWWTTPERNANAEITGLTLRGLHDGSMKPMYQKSKHGLIYPVREDFDPETAGYEKGKHNWLRTDPDGVSCPVCGKPDGCLVASDDPDDPKAVICIRVEDGADRPMDFGWLHILKAEGHVSAGCPLPASSDPVIVVEGLSDTATAIDLGFVAVGRASAAFTKGLRDLCKGRPIIVVGENDEPDKFGRVAGLAGLNKVYDLLYNVVPEITKVLPPEDSKDLREWRKKHNLTRDSFLQYVQSYGNVEPPTEILPSGDPLPVASMWLRDKYWDDVRDLPTLRSYGGVWYKYDGVKYKEHKDENFLRGEMYKWLDGKRYMKNEDELALYIPTRARINDLMDALNAHCPIIQDPPSWITGEEKSDPQSTVVFNNGVLHVDRYLAGEDNILTPLTPAFFTLAALPYDFDAEATCPLWMQYLDSTFGTDARAMEKRDLLQEWFGYNMVADMSMEKMLLMIGRSGSGKGTALAAFTALIGKHQIASTKMKSISEQFGVEPLMGKLSAIMSDLRIPRSADSMQALETLLQIVGGDAIDVPRKHRTNLASISLTCRFTVAANELPELPDHSQALARRLAILHFDKSFVGREDTTLKDRLPEEAPGLAVWGLAGLRRLRSAGRFTEPASSEKIADDMRKVTSPVSEFVEDCCLLDETGKTQYQDMFNLWAGWAVDRGMRPGHRTRFQQRMLAAFPTIELRTEVSNRTKHRVYAGIELDPTALRKYT